MIVRRYYRGLLVGAAGPRRHPLAAAIDRPERGVRHVGLSKMDREEVERLAREEEAQAGSLFFPGVTRR